MRTTGLFAALLASVGLVLVEFVYRHHLTRRTYHWLFCRTGRPPQPGAPEHRNRISRRNKNRRLVRLVSCDASVRDRHVQSRESDAGGAALSKPLDSRSTVLRLSMTYGVHGAWDAQLASARHWLLYIAGSWQEPIRHRGTFPNKNCLACHAGAQRFARVSFHVARAADLFADRIGCMSCHGAPHPAPSERKAMAGAS